VAEQAAVSTAAIPASATARSLPPGSAPRLPTGPR